MRKALLASAALGSLALAPLLSTGAQAANLVQNGSFETTTLPPTLNPANASGAEIDSNWNYNGDLTGWSSTGSSTYNVLFFGNVAAASSIDADTRYTASEPQHLNSNFNSLSPNGGNFMGLDGDPAANGPLDQTISGLTSGQTYELSFYWAGGELSNRTGYTSNPADRQPRRRPVRHDALPEHRPGAPGLVLGLDAREFHLHRECFVRVAVVPGGRDACRQPAAVRPSGWRVADRGPRAVDLGDDARRVRRARLCRLSPSPDGSRGRIRESRSGLLQPGRNWITPRLCVMSLSRLRPRDDAHS